MKDRTYYIGERRTSGRRRWRWVLLALLLLLAGLNFFRVGSPIGELELKLPGIGPNTPVEGRAFESGRGLAGARLELEQGGETTVLAEEDYAPRRFWAFWGDRVSEATLVGEAGSLLQPDLQEGPATVRLVLERAGTWLRSPPPVVVEELTEVRLKPPSLSVLAESPNLRQGGAGVVVYRLERPASWDGVEVGARRFPGRDHPAGDGSRVAFFAAPWDVADAGAFELTAYDDLGNRASRRFVRDWKNQPPRESTIGLSDGFMERVVPAILAESSMSEEATLLDSYLKINGALRAQNDQTLIELALGSRPEILWRGAFRQQPNSQVTDAFASRRRYMYEGRLVDRQTHLGYDLASRRRDAIVAANSGVVVFARYLGIYGRLVVVDHGYGLQTLYAHLSSFEVAEGDAVEKGDVVGRSGQTGLAGGDHLHFSVLVWGIPADPVQWWDAFWIDTRVLEPLGLADE